MRFQQIAPCLALAVALTGCAPASGSPSAASSPQTDGIAGDSWNAAGAAEIRLTANGFEATGAGITVQDRVLTIAKGGTYVLTGSLDNGQVVVDAQDAQIQLVLNGASLSCVDSAPIYAKDGKLTVTLAQGTENSLADGENYVFADGGDEPSATLFSKDDLTINGSGALTVTADFQHAIASKDDLVLDGGTLTVTAKADGIRGRDSLTVNGGSVTVQAGEDGLKSNNDEDASKGTVFLNGGAVNVTAGSDAIQAETALTVNGGVYTITTGGGSGEDHYEGETSCKGFKAGAALTISGGTLNLDTLDDAIHSNGTVDLSGGTVSIATGDDALHGDGALNVSGGEVIIYKCYEGLEGLNITMSGGTVRVTASDDGVNASDPTAQEGPGAAMPHQNRSFPNGMVHNGTMGTQPVPPDQAEDPPAGPIPPDAQSPAAGQAAAQPSLETQVSSGRQTPETMQDTPPAGRMGGHKTVNENIFIRITGGTLAVDSQGDALDSNGALYLDGGLVLLNGPSGNGDGALDYNGACTLTGGTLLAAGSAGMAQAPDEGSSQPSLMLYFTQQQAAGATVAFATEAGEPIAAFTPSKPFQTLVFSSPALQTGETILVSTGGSGASDADGYSENWSGGETLTKVTLSGAVTRINEDGSTVTGGMGGMSGGMRGKGINGEQRTPQ